ncbi:MAG: hypothetical protein NUV86_12905 [Candidatus Scalindua sp.]|nr:hypothetical protein [Candidatus Scalindua sp.]MCR4344974.1 hypothetical protein [Candidatus Scalindua sp.]
MGKFTVQQKNTVDKALGVLDKIIDCYKKLPKDKQDTPEKYIKEKVCGSRARNIQLYS